MDRFLKEKLELEDLTIRLGQVTRDKWLRLATMRQLQDEEDSLIRKIAETTEAIENLEKE
jgi:hypothetical protein